MNIYPKTCRNLVGIDALMPFIEKYKGVELQFFDEKAPMERFEFESVIDNLMKKCSCVKEVTIHPPLSLYDIEYIISKDINIVKEQFETMVKLSRKYNIKLNIVYHTMLQFKGHLALTVDKIKECLKILEGENVTLLIENLFMFFERRCTAYELADYLNHPNCKVCMDICHLHCRANIDKKDINEYIKDYLDKTLCEKYTYQVHFASALNNDGYVDHKTHGRKHDSLESMIDDLRLLKEYGMEKCNYITEVSEEDYDLRADQVKELEMLEQVASEE